MAESNASANLLASLPAHLWYNPDWICDTMHPPTRQLHPKLTCARQGGLLSAATVRVLWQSSSYSSFRTDPRALHLPPNTTHAPTRLQPVVTTRVEKPIISAFPKT